MRTPAEGLKDEFTKPGRKKNRMNTGAKASVCAVISNGRIVLCHYLPKTWNGQAAADLYANITFKTLQRVPGKKRAYILIEDNDPTGYKSSKAKVSKASLGIKVHVFPRYSPDISPLDFSVWKVVEAKVLANCPKRVETVVEYKARMRLTALRVQRVVVFTAVGALAKRVRQLKDVKGGNIPRNWMDCV